MDYLDKKSIRDIEVREKTVFLRCDFNVPLDPNGNITDTRRIDESWKTIKYLVNNNIMSGSMNKLAYYAFFNNVAKGKDVSLKRKKQL